MPAELVFNELSLVPLCVSAPVATERMRQFFILLAAIQKHAGGQRPLLRSSVPINEWLLAADYPVKRWRNDPSVDAELRRKLLTVQVNWPVVSPETEPEVATKQNESEYFYNGTRADGLGVAALLDGLGISFNQPPWGDSQVRLTEHSLASDGSLAVEEMSVRHASQPVHADGHARWLEPAETIAGGSELWARRAELFPALAFCLRVERQLDALDRGHPLLDQIVARLRRLNDYAAKWHEGSFCPDDIGIKITPESTPTLKRYGAEHTFSCPDDVERLFSWHARLTPHAWRLFFEPLRPGQFFIGHIGEKLPTVTY